MKTIALVIGNDAYPGNNALNNAINDAKSMAEAFRKMQYHVIDKYDCNSEDYISILSDFEMQITDYDAAIVYFAGHGFQFKDENYLTSIECPIDVPNKHMCDRYSIRLSEILKIFEASNTTINVVILDACRHNIGRGTSSVLGHEKDIPKGTFLAFSTSPGGGAKDKGLEGHSVYTGTLLKYIGRELISIEDLFKKVRKTVYNLTNGSQITWEHTSIIDDFYFNEGQMTYFSSMPYKDDVIKDRSYIIQDNKVDQLISEMKICDWNIQNPAIAELRNISLRDISIDQQFLIGRNLLQAFGYPKEANRFFENLKNNLEGYMSGEDNHVLNGILFEVYFNNNGDFRRNNLKKKALPYIFSVRRLPKFKNSFNFIYNALQPHKNDLYYLINNKDEMIDIDVLINSEDEIHVWGENKIHQIIEQVKIGTKDITKSMSQICELGLNELGLKRRLSEFMAAPEELIHINSSKHIKHLIFRYNME